MSDRKISQLTSITAIDLFDVIPINHEGTTQKVTVDTLLLTGNRKVLKQTHFDCQHKITYLVNTSLQEVSATLPLTPNIGDYIGFEDPYLTWNYRPLIINNNENMIQTHKDRLVCDLKGLNFSLTYVGGTIGWRVD
jgi:hypothetical protein